MRVAYNDSDDRAGLRGYVQFNKYTAGRPGSSEVHRHPLTRWDVSSIPANGIFLTKETKK